MGCGVSDSSSAACVRLFPLWAYGCISAFPDRWYALAEPHGPSGYQSGTFLSLLRFHHTRGRDPCLRIAAPTVNARAMLDAASISTTLSLDFLFAQHRHR